MSVRMGGRQPKSSGRWELLHASGPQLDCCVTRRTKKWRTNRWIMTEPWQPLGWRVIDKWMTLLVSGKKQTIYRWWSGTVEVRCPGEVVVRTTWPESQRCASTCSRAARLVLRASFSLSMPSTCSWLTALWHATCSHGWCCCSADPWGGWRGRGAGAVRREEEWIRG